MGMSGGIMKFAILLTNVFYISMFFRVALTLNKAFCGLKQPVRISMMSLN